MRLPLVSTIVPAYNAMPWLEETLASILAQTVSDLEVIVVDDGSIDGTAAYAKACSARDSRVRCLTQRNSGLARARNAGIEAAAGQYITFLDSDDLWAPVKLERQLALMADRPGVAVLTALRRFSDREGTRDWSFDTVPPHGDREGAYLRSLLFLRNVDMVGIASCLARTDDWRSLGGYDPSLASAEDWDMWLRVARKFQLLTVPGEPLQYYRKRAGSLTTRSNLDRDFDAWRKILLKQLSLGGVSATAVRRAVAMKRLECAEMNRVRGRPTAVLRDLFCSLADPSLLRTRQFHQTWVRLVRGG